MSNLLLDTHTLIWHLLKPTRLSPAADAAIEAASKSGDVIGFSAISIVEIQYLTEKGRVPSDTFEAIENFIANPKLRVSVKAVDHRIALSTAAVPRHQVPDMPDRIIAATALSLNLPLVTRDLRIRASNVQTIW